MLAGFPVLVVPERPGCAAAAGVVHDELVSTLHFYIDFPSGDFIVLDFVKQSGPGHPDPGSRYKRI